MRLPRRRWFIVPALGLSIAAVLWIGGMEGIESMSKGETSATRPPAGGSDTEGPRPPETRAQELVEAGPRVALHDPHRWLAGRHPGGEARWGPVPNAPTRRPLATPPGPAAGRRLPGRLVSR